MQAIVVVLALAFLMGCVCGLRSMTGPAIVCWAAHLGWLNLDGSKLAFLHHRLPLVIFTLAAAGELIVDKLPFVPRRTMIAPLVVRFLSGALCGAAWAWWFPSTLSGGIGGVAGAFAGYHLRRWLTVSRGLPDLPVALLEDAVGIGMGLLVVSGGLFQLLQLLVADLKWF
jgi:uncharacterized membrane protein